MSEISEEATNLIDNFEYAVEDAVSDYTMACGASQKHQARRNLEDYIAELEAAQRWRVVANGELPEVYRNEDGEFIPFLVCEGDGDRPFIAMYGGTNWHAGIFVPDVTHWMPLPGMPEAEE